MTRSDEDQLLLHYTDGRTEVLNLPPDQRKFKIGYPLNNKLVAITGTLPDGIEEVSVIFCSELQYLPNLNPGLKSLYISCSNSLKHLPSLPASLKQLIITRCESIEEVGSLPASLELLRIDWCDRVGKVGDIPSTLKSLDIWNCRKLKTLPTLPKDLQHLRMQEELVRSVGVNRLKGELSVPTLIKFIWQTHYIDLRHTLINQYGLDQFILDSGVEPKEIDKDQLATLYRVDYPEADPLFLVRLTNLQEDSLVQIDRLVDPLCRTMSTSSQGRTVFGKEQQMTARNAAVATLGLAS